MDLAESILRKMIRDHDREGCVLVERYEHGGISALFDSSWFDITPEEADYIDALKQQDTDSLTNSTPPPPSH